MSNTDASDRRPLLVLQSAAYDGSLARSALDVVLSFAVFAQRPMVLFSGAAALCLLSQQEPSQLGRKSLRKVIDSFPLYDVEDVFVDVTALESFAIEEHETPDFVRSLSVEERRALCSSASVILSL